MSRCDGCGSRLPGDAENWCPVCGSPLLPDASSWVLGVPDPSWANAAVKSASGLGTASLPESEARPRRLRWWRAVWVVGALALLGGIGTRVYLLPRISAPDGAAGITSTSSPRTQRDPQAEARRYTRPSENYRGATQLVIASGGAPRFLTRDAASGKYGYADETGFLVIEPQFIRAHAFSEGLARVEVEINGVHQYGFIDQSGTMVIEPQYSAASDFSEGLAAVWLSDAFGQFGYGFIDRTGTLIIGPQFESAREFSEGLAAVAIDGKWGYIDRTGTTVIEPQFYYASSFMPSGFAAVHLKDPGRASDEDEPADEGYPGLHKDHIDKTGRVVSEHQKEQAQ